MCFQDGDVLARETRIERRRGDHSWRRKARSACDRVTVATRCSSRNGHTAVTRWYYSAVTARRQHTHLASYALVLYFHDLMSAAAVGRPPASRRSTSVSSGSTHSPSSSISKGATARAAASPRVPSNLSPASRRGSIKSPSPPALTGETRESLALALRHETDAKEQVWLSWHAEIRRVLNVACRFVASCAIARQGADYFVSNGGERPHVFCVERGRVPPIRTVYRAKSNGRRDVCAHRGRREASSASTRA